MDEMLFIKNFPANVQIPESLIKLFRFQEAENKNYSGHFFLYDRFWQQAPLFSPDVQSQLIFFGFDADGSIYSFWRYKDFPLEIAPIVFLASEWAGNIIIANSVEEFLGLLGLGIDELGYAVSQQGWETRISNGSETINFRMWLKNELDISIPQEPTKVVEKAINNHPDFNIWLQRKTGLPPEKKQKPF